MATDRPPSDRDVQQALFEHLIDVIPEESAHSEHWHRAVCECDWSTTGGQVQVTDAGYEHIMHVHMRGIDVLARLMGFL